MLLAVVHELPGRMRLRASPAMRNTGRLGSTAEALRAIAGVQEVHAQERTGSILVFYDAPEVRETLHAWIAAGEKKTAGGKPGAAGKNPPPMRWIAPFAVRKETLPEASAHRPVRNPIPGRLIRSLLPVPVRAALALLGCVPYLWKGLRALSGGRLDLDVLDASALLVCLLRRDFLAAGTITFFFALGEFLEDWTRKKSRASLTESLALNIEHVWIREGDIEREILMRDVRPGDWVVVRVGAVIPVDGTVVEGDALVNQSSMTGEPLPVQRSAGSTVYAGTVLAEGMLVIRATKVGGDMRIASIVRFIEESEERKAAIESRYEHIADGIVPYNFLLALVVLAVTRDPVRASSVLLVDYSCAIRLSTPLAVLSAMRESARRGVLIKGGKFMEALAQADTVVFDKTGTLTEARPILVDVIPFEKYSRTAVLKLSACLEEHFVHPVGQAIVRAAEEENLAHREEHAEVEFIVAHGIASQWRGKRVLIGSEHFVLEDEKIPVTAAQRKIIDAQAAQGRSVLYLAIGNALAGILMIEDKIRQETASVVEELRKDGIRRILMLTGDGTLTAQSIAEKAGIAEFRAQMLPEDKAQVIEALKRDGCRVMMIGDGMNDSPALSAAHVGVAMVDGADIAREVADVVLTRGHLRDLLDARRLSRLAMQRIEGNFRTSVALNTAFLGGGLTGAIPPMVSAVLHNLTTAAVALGSMRPLMPPHPEHAVAVETKTDTGVPLKEPVMGEAT